MSQDNNNKKTNENFNLNANIKVFGCGGAGCNVTENMIVTGLEGVDFYIGNTDSQALGNSKCKNKLQFGKETTRGLGAGANPDVGETAARESADEIRKALEGADMVFVTAGMGGGSGTGASPIVAEIAKELGALTVGVVTKPFRFEGNRRMKNAEEGIEKLKQHVDTLIVIPNQRLLSISGRNTTLTDTFKKADDILFQAVKGISDLILVEGLVNVDFADVRTIMTDMGMAMMGTGESRGENRAVEAAEKAISSPLLEDVSIHGAQGVLINITASPDVTLNEINEAAEMIHAEAHEEANIIWGMVIDDTLEDTVRATVIATGFAEKTTAPVINTQNNPIFGSQNRQNTRKTVLSGLGMNKFTKTNPSEIIGKGATTNNTTPKQETVKIGNISVLSSDDDIEIPTFLRKTSD